MTLPNLTVQTADAFSDPLELAADDNLPSLELTAERHPSSISDLHSWFCRKKGSHRPELLSRTPLMVAATYGSLNVLSFLISQGVDINRPADPDKTTALHCAASGGADLAVPAARLLLAAGADPNAEDSDGLRPSDVVASPPNAPDRRIELLDLLGGLRVSTISSSSASPPLSTSPSSDSSSTSLMKFPEKKEYPIDPTLADMKHSIYSTDEFRMFSFKVRPCSRAYSHDWTECPFVHPGENARRRDPRKFHYSCVPCPDSRKGVCRRGDLCEYAHGVFECWLHPAQYRTRLCKDGTFCNRRVCFFAHTSDELRPLFVSTGSAVPSPPSEIILNSTTPISSWLSQSQFTPPMSPSAAWAASVVPALHLPGSNLSHLRTSLNARDITLDELSMIQLERDAQQQLLYDYGCFSPQLGSARCKAIIPSNLDGLFAMTPEGIGAASAPRVVYSPTHKGTTSSQLHQQQQSLLSPIKTKGVLGTGSARGAGGMSPRGLEPMSPMGSRMVAAAALVQMEKQLQCQKMRRLTSKGHAVSPLSMWGSSGKVEWAVNEEELGRLRTSNSFGKGGGDELDVSWVQMLVKESPPEKRVRVEAAADHMVLSGLLEKMQIDQAAPSSDGWRTGNPW